MFNTPLNCYYSIAGLIASVLMVVLAAIVLYLSNNVLESWQGATNDYAQDLEADIVLDYLARDLSGAFFRDDGKTWLISDQGASQTTPGSTLWLRFFTSARDRDRNHSGDLNAVSYRLLPIDPLTASSTTSGLSSLYRTVIESDESFQQMQGNLENVEESRFHDFSDPRTIEHRTIFFAGQYSFI